METIEAAQERKAGFLTGISLLIPITLAVMGIVVLAPVLPQMQIAFRGTPHADYLVPMILTAPALCVLLFSWFAGMLGDTFGRRRLLIAAMIVYAGLGILPAFLGDIWSILLSRFGVGICEAIIMTLSTALIGDFFHGQARDRWLASQAAVASLSALLFFNIGGFLGRFGWRGPFAIYASSLLMVLLVLRYTWEPKREGNAETTQAKLTWVGFPWAQLSGAAAVAVFSSIMFYIVQIEAGFGLNAHGISDPAQIGFLTSLASLAVPLGTFVFQFLARVPTAALLLIEYLILGGGFLEMSRAATANEFLIAAAVNQVGAGMMLPTLLTWIMRPLSFDFRSRGAAVWMASFSGGQFLCPIVVTAISGWSGGLLPAFHLLGFICFAAAAAALAAFLLHRQVQSVAGAPL
jgi:predicted MFS family arabinose efflux permease